MNVTDKMFDMMRREANKKVRRRRPVYSEDRLQINCIHWFDLQYPEYCMLLHHSPNEGVRTAANGGKLRSMGMRAGFPDLVLLPAVPQKPFVRSDSGR